MKIFRGNLMITKDSTGYHVQMRRSDGKLILTANSETLIELMSHIADAIGMEVDW